MFPLNAGNDPGEKALAYFEEMCKNHGPDRAEEMLNREFPWIDEVRKAARPDNNRHPHHKKACEFMRGFNYLRRQYKRFEEEVQEVKEDIEEAYKNPTDESPGPTALMEAWFADNDRLYATFEELSHFTGFTPGSFGYPIRKLEQNGFRFIREGSCLRAVERPSDKEDMIDEALETLDKLSKEELEYFLDVLNTNFDRDA